MSLLAFDTLLVFLKECFVKVKFEKSADDNKSMKHYPAFKGEITVTPLLSHRSKIDKTKVLMTNGSLMKVERIAECSPWSILQYF